MTLRSRIGCVSVALTAFARAALGQRVGLSVAPPSPATLGQQVSLGVRPALSAATYRHCVHIMPMRARSVSRSNRPAIAAS